jgi:2-aminoadipate transaminase
VVLCEDPSFIGALNAFRSNGAVTKGIPLLRDGIDTDALEATLKEDRAGENRIKMLYLIPTFHNPAGITTSLSTRRRIYEIAVKYSLIILEDNPYGELRFAGEEIPTIKSMDSEGVVLYCSSFSKILSAGMRVGFIVGPEALMQKMVVAKQVEDVHTNQFFQMLCHRFIVERDLDAHIEKIRAIYRRKCGIMMRGLEENLPDSFTFTRPEGGLFVWCTLPEEIDMQEFVARCLKKKLAIVPGTAFCPDENGTSNSVRFNYSTPSEEQIERGCVILGEVAREMLSEASEK